MLLLKQPLQNFIVIGKHGIGNETVYIFPVGSDMEFDTFANRKGISLTVGRDSAVGHRRDFGCRKRHEVFSRRSVKKNQRNAKKPKCAILQGGLIGLKGF
jgi:hypothetical protein